MQKTRVTCLKCKKSAQVIISGDKIQYINHLPIVSARFRVDQKWGFECACGNDNRLAKEEISQIGMLVQGAKHVEDRLTKNASKPSGELFKVESS